MSRAGAPAVDPYPAGADHTLGDGNDAPYAVGRKFNADGSVRRFAGNTVICAVPENTALFDALVAVQTGLMEAPFADPFAFLPPSSLHMTLFEGINDPERTPERWPRDLPLDMPLDTVTEAFMERLSGVQLPAQFRLVPDALLCSPRGGSVLVMRGRSEADERDLRDARDLLSERLRHSKPNHAGYRFHISLSYQIRWLDRPAADRLAHANLRLLERLRGQAPEITVGTPTLCTFDDMTRFDPVLALSA